MLPATPPVDMPYTDDYFEPVWLAAVELDLPNSMHIVTNAGATGKTRDSALSDAINPAAKAETSQPQSFATSPLKMQKTLASLVIGAFWTGTRICGSSSLRLTLDGYRISCTALTINRKNNAQSRMHG